MLKNLLNRILPKPPADVTTPAPVPAPCRRRRRAGRHRRRRRADRRRQRAARTPATLRRPRRCTGAVAKAPRPRARAPEPGHRAGRPATTATAPSRPTNGCWRSIRAHPFGNYNYARLALLRGDLARAEALVRDGPAGEAAIPAGAGRAVQRAGSAGQARAGHRRAGGRAAPAARRRRRLVQPGRAAPARPARATRPRPRCGGRSNCEPGNIGRPGAAQPRVLRDQGFADEALAPLREASRTRPRRLAASLAGADADELRRRHPGGRAVSPAPRVRRATWSGRSPRASTASARARDPQRRLRVGYLSGDLSSCTR